MGQLLEMFAHARVSGLVRTLSMRYCTTAILYTIVVLQDQSRYRPQVLPHKNWGLGLTDFFSLCCCQSLPHRFGSLIFCLGTFRK